MQFNTTQTHSIQFNSNATLVVRGAIPCTRALSRRRSVRPNACDTVVAHASTHTINFELAMMPARSTDSDYDSRFEVYLHLVVPTLASLVLGGAIIGRSPIFPIFFFDHNNSNDDNSNSNRNDSNNSNNNNNDNNDNDSNRNEDNNNSNSSSNINTSSSSS